MSSVIVAIAGQSPAHPLAWFVTSSNGQPVESGESLLGALASAGRTRMHLVLPGDLVTAHETRLPSRSEREALAAAPFAIEDQIASDLEDVHLVLAPPQADRSDGVRTAYVVDKSLMQAWLEAASEAGVTLESILPDYLTLPEPAPGQVILCAFPGRTLIRHGAWGGAVPDDLGQDMVDLLVGQRMGVEETVWLDPEQVWAQVCRGALDGKVNLRQGPYARRRPRSAFNWRQLRLPAGMAVVAAGLAMGMNVAEGMAFNTAAEEMRADTVTTFRAAFPEVTQVVNPRAQLRSRLSGGGASEPEFLIMSAWLALSRDEAPGVTLESLRYDSQTGDLVLSVRYAQYDDLAALRRFIEEAGGRVEEGGSRQAVDGGRIGELTVARP